MIRRRGQAAMRNAMKITLPAMLLAVMLVLGYIEKLLAIAGPVPGIKLGLSNGVLLICLYWLGIPASIMLMLGKVGLMALMFGSQPVTIAMSLSGGVLSMLGMIGMVYLIKGVSPVGAGILGGVLHNIGQVVFYMLIAHINLLYYLAILVLVGAVMGAITGTVANTLMRFLPYERRVTLGIVRKKTSAEKALEEQQEKGE
jgi:heptaprenyl diphosphate synthase